jgi:hypothetical protein
MIAALRSRAAREARDSGAFQVTGVEKASTVPQQIADAPKIGVVYEEGSPKIL